MSFPLEITTELQLDGIWTDVSADVLQRDKVRIRRGRSDEAAQADPSTCDLTFNNTSGDYSPRNPTGAYYGVLGRNTPLRVTVNMGINTSARFYGEVSTWPPQSDPSGTDVYTQVTAAGVLRRLLQGASPRSALRRALVLADDVVAYWPCEDSAGATSLASALPGFPAMLLSGPVAAASFSEFKTSLPIPTASGVRWSGTVPVYAATGDMQLRFLLAVPEDGVAAQATICRLFTTGVPRWDLDVDTAGALQLRAFDSNGGVLGTSGFVAHNVNGKLLRVSVEIQDNFGLADWEFSTLEVGEAGATTTSGSVAHGGVEVASATLVEINPAGGLTVDDAVAVGHISVEKALTFNDPDDLNAHAGETAGDRITRLCSEDGVAFSLLGDADDTSRLGAQLPKTTVELLREAAAADLGILYEARGFLGLEYRTRASLYAQDPALELDYSAGDLSAIEPTEDDQATRNDVTVDRVDGAAARAELTTGALSVNPPPDGVGRYDDTVTLNLEADSDTPDQAGWRLHLGTVDEARYPVLEVNLARDNFTSDSGLTDDVEALDVGDKVTVTNLPDWISPDDTSQLVQGFTETLTPFTWDIEVNCAPASPWDIAVYGDDTGPGEARYSSSGSTLAEDLTTTETAIDVASVSALWTDKDQPFDITIGGERMTVTAVSGSSSL